MTSDFGPSDSMPFSAADLIQRGRNGQDFFVPINFGQLWSILTPVP